MPNSNNNVTDGHAREHPVAERAAATAKAETRSQDASPPTARQDFGPGGAPADRTQERDTMGTDPRGPYAPGSRGPTAPLPGAGRRNG